MKTNGGVYFVIFFFRFFLRSRGFYGMMNAVFHFVSFVVDFTANAKPSSMTA